MQEEALGVPGDKIGTEEEFQAGPQHLLRGRGDIRLDLRGREVRRGKAVSVAAGTGREIRISTRA
jgi:hypothetical protein